MRNPVAETTIPGQIVPYTRVGRAHWAKPAKRYHESQNRIIALMRATPAMRRLPRRPDGAPRLTVRVAVYLPRTKKGRLSKRCGDWDNLFKAVLDAAVRGGYIPDDSGYYVAGPADGCGLWPCEQPRVEVAFFEEVEGGNR